MRYQVGAQVTFTQKLNMSTTIGKGYKIQKVDLWMSPLEDTILILDDSGDRIWVYTTAAVPYWESELERILFWGDYEDNKS